MSNSVAVQEKRFVRLIPSNNSQSGFSPVGAQPIIRFSVADTQALVHMKDARLNFKIKCTNAASTPVAGQDINIDPVMGFCSVLDQVIISSRRHGTQLEQVVNLGRLESSYYRSRYSPKMMSSCQYHGSKAIGLGRKNRWSGQFAAAQTSDNSALKAIAMRKVINNADQEVSIPIHAGMFLTDEPLDLAAVGGLEIAIYLQKNDGMFYGSDANISSLTYTLTDVSLTMPFLYKSIDMIQATAEESVVEFLNWTSLFSVLDSSVSSVAHRISLSGLVSAIHNSLPTAQLNALGFNQFALKSTAPERLTFQRDGMRAPLEKTMIAEDKRSTKTIDKATTFPEILNEYLSAWGAPKDLRFSQVIPELVKGVANRDGVFGLGCNYSPNSSGINVSGVLSMDLQSKIEDDTNKDPTQTEPYALFSFYLSRQSYVMGPAGIKAL